LSRGECWPTGRNNGAATGRDGKNGGEHRYSEDGGELSHGELGDGKDGDWLEDREGGGELRNGDGGAVGKSKAGDGGGE
jgi:hypothetical protein